MSQEDTPTLNFGNGPMTIRRSLNNILASLNIAQGKGCFNLRESAYIFSSLQKMNEFVNKYENIENGTNTPEVSNPPSNIPTPPQPKPQPKPEVTLQKAQQVVRAKPVNNTPKSSNQPLPDINLEDGDDINEIIEI